MPDSLDRETRPAPENRARLCAELLADQRERWARGDRVSAEAYLAEWPALRDDPESTAEMVLGEFLLREQRGESPALDEYGARFPAWADGLARQIALYRLLDDEAANEGAGAAEPPSLPGFALLGELGRGGAAVVYKARQAEPSRDVALKLAPLASLLDADVLRRFRDEANAAARLHHPNIVPLHEIGWHEGRPYLVMEFVAGGNLREHLAGAPLPARAAAALLETVARAVQHAHAHGVVHRDLKPANILLTAEGTPKIADFGLARLVGVSDGPTPTGAVLGTPSYMAPEQAAGLKDVGPRADIYALGAVLYECLTGRPPFKAATPLETLDQVRTRDPAPPTRLNPSLPRDLDTVCLKCLEKDPQRRYAAPAALADDLARFLRGEPVAARPVGAVGRVWRWSRRRPLVASLVALLAVTALGSGGGLFALWRRAAAEHAEAERNYADIHTLLAEFVHFDRGSEPRSMADFEGRAALLRRADVFVGALLAKRPRDLSALAARVDLDAALARLASGQGLQEAVEAHLARAETTAALLPRAAPRSLACLRNLAAAYESIAQAHRDQSRPTEASLALRQAVLLRRALLAASPSLSARRDALLAEVQFADVISPSSTASSTNLERIREALRLLRDAPPTGAEDPVPRRRLIELSLALGDRHEKNGQLAAARELWQAAADEGQGLVAETGWDIRTETALAECRLRLIGGPDATAHYDEAVRRFDRVFDHLAARLEADPANQEALRALIVNRQRLADGHRRAGAAEAVTRTLTQATALQERLVVQLGRPGWEGERIWALGRLCELYLGADQPDRALARAREAARLLGGESAAAAPLGRPRRASLLRLTAHWLKQARATPEEAMRLAEQARRLFLDLLGEAPARLDVRLGLFETLEEIGKIHVAAGRPDDATKTWGEATVVLREAIARELPGTEMYRIRLGGRYLRLGRHVAGQGRLAEAERWFLDQEALWPNDAAALREVAREMMALADKAGDASGRQHFLAQSERVERTAEKIER